MLPFRPVCRLDEDTAHPIACGRSQAFVKSGVPTTSAAGSEAQFPGAASTLLIQGIVGIGRPVPAFPSRTRIKPSDSARPPMFGDTNGGAAKIHGRSGGKLRASLRSPEVASKLVRRIRKSRTLGALGQTTGAKCAGRAGAGRFRYSGLEVCPRIASIMGVWVSATEPVG